MSASATSPPLRLEAGDPCQGRAGSSASLAPAFTGKGKGAERGRRTVKGRARREERSGAERRGEERRGEERSGAERGQRQRERREAERKEVEVSEERREEARER